MSKKFKKRGKNSFFNYFKPSITLKNFSELDPYLLKINNIKLFICDLDDTLAPTYNSIPSRSVIKFVETIKALGIKFWVCSNNSRRRVQKFCNYLKPDGIVSFASKPWSFKVRKILKIEKVKPEETIIMGDQFLIDIFVANRLGCKSILVVPLAGQTRTKSTKLIDFLEKKIYKKLSSNSLLTTSDSFENDTKLL